MSKTSSTKEETRRSLRHVAIIMDGNGRWAQARCLPRSIGHKHGVEALRRTVQAAIDFNIRYLTLFGFSSENWQRPSYEVSELMGLLRLYLRNETVKLQKWGVRLQIIGNRDQLSKDIVTAINKAEIETYTNDRLILTVALSYGARNEIVQAARHLAQEAVDGTLHPEAIDETLFSTRLFTANMPDPDLLIRTSGEKRISNFLLWQLAYTELVFINVHWPDFGRSELGWAIAEFHKRERRYGTV